MRPYYAFFFVSGFCSILYELVWLRLAMAQFGVTTPLVSMVLSFFMAGMGLGAWVTGRWLSQHGERLRFPRLRLYAGAELLIAMSGILVPLQLLSGHQILLRIGNTSSFSSFSYYILSGGCLFLTLVPWCACMGATFPLAMFAVVGKQTGEARRSFSYLYLANVLGATVGAVFPLLLIEELGFSRTLRVGSALNVGLACCAFLLAKVRHIPSQGVKPNDVRVVGIRARRGIRWLLFATGLTSMGMELVWIRMFTPYLGTVVYSFASILAVYLMATFVGTKMYRKGRADADYASSRVWAALALGGLVPLLSTDPITHLEPLVRLIFGIAPFAVAAGFATPMLVDWDSQGDPERAASAYAINVLGCIIGPLLSGFALLPGLGERGALAVLALPWFVIVFFLNGPAIASEDSASRVRKAVLPWTIGIAGLVLFVATNAYEGRYPNRRVLRDHTATVIASGAGMDKHLLVNGVGITALTPITKMMVHLPMAFLSLKEKPESVLVICFGMGTTHRSALSWGGQSTAVELVPSVPQLFSYFHADGDSLLQSPRSRVVIDDGRRFLELSQEKFDLITIDPPPPVEAAGSSLLYSEEFYWLAKRRLKPGGILQQWLPGGDAATTAAVAKAIRQSFPYIRMFRSIEGWGFHFLASSEPIAVGSPAELAGRLPSAAVADLLEWGPEATAERQFDRVLRNEISIDSLIRPSPETVALQDDRPVNEYFLLRSLGVDSAFLHR